MIWVTQLINGVLLGGYYALLACGLSFMFGVMRIINLAHGDFAIIAACLVFLVADFDRHSALRRAHRRDTAHGGPRLAATTRHART